MERLAVGRAVLFGLVVARLAAAEDEADGGRIIELGQIAALDDIARNVGARIAGA